MDKRAFKTSPDHRIVTKDLLVTLADLETFKEDLLLAIRGMLTQSISAQQTKWLKSYEVKKLLGISHGTLQVLRNNGTIPFSKIGGILYYDIEDVNRVLNKQKRNPVRRYVDS